MFVITTKAFSDQNILLIRAFDCQSGLLYNRAHLQTSSLLIPLSKIADWQSKARINKIFWSENALVVIMNNPDRTSSIFQIYVRYFFLVLALVFFDIHPLRVPKTFEVYKMTCFH